MTRLPLYSIIIPTYNRAELLRRAINSVKRQTFQDFEVIVIDNQSDDHTRKVIASFEDSRITMLEINNGGIIAASRNLGISWASGEWICFLDSDDWWYPRKLETVHRFLSEADIIYHDLDVYDSSGKRYWKKVKGRQLSPPIFSSLMKSGNVMVTSSVVVRKQILEQVGGLDEDASIVASEDYDLCLRIARATERFTYIPRSLGAYWMGGGNMTEISERQIERMEAVYRKHMAFLKEEDRQDVVTIINYGRARILQKMGHAMESAALFRETLRTRMLNIKIKSLYCLVISYLQGRCR